MKETSEVYQNCLKQAREWGFGDEHSPEPLARLMTYVFEEGFELSKEELSKWKRLGVLDRKGRLYIGKNEEDNGIFWIMQGLVWHGLATVDRRRPRKPSIHRA